MFVCTYGVSLSLTAQKFSKELADKMEPKGDVIVINSNFAHKCLPGYESLIKTPEDKEKKKLAKKSRKKKNKSQQETKVEKKPKKPRKQQGDGTCFRHAFEPIIKIGVANYHVRYFPASGDTQIPGIVCQDYSDAHATLNIFVKYLNETKLFGDVSVKEEKLTLRNYKFELQDVPSGTLLRFNKIADYFRTSFVDDDFVIDEIDYSNDDNRLSISFILKSELKEKPITTVPVKTKSGKSKKKHTLLKFFPGGKMNILGVKKSGGAEKLYDCIKRTFAQKWNDFIMIKPKPDRKPTTTPITT
jgi:hypothetical protein